MPVWLQCVSKSLYIAFRQKIPIVHVNRFKNEFFLMSALSDAIFWFIAVVNKRV